MAAARYYQVVDLEVNYAVFPLPVDNRFCFPGFGLRRVISLVSHTQLQLSMQRVLKIRRSKKANKSRQTYPRQRRSITLLDGTTPFSLTSPGYVHGLFVDLSKKE